VAPQAKSVYAVFSNHSCFSSQKRDLQRRRTSVTI
jgi:hypothetical protein